MSRWALLTLTLILTLTLTLTLPLTLTLTLTNQVLTTDAATRKKFLGEIDNLLDDGFYATGSNM